MVLIALAISLVFSIVNYHRTRTLNLNTAIEGLAGEAKLIKLHFKTAYQEVKNDLKIVSYTPPIQGIIRSLHHKGIDPKDKSTTQLWKNRLATIFFSIMQANPSYMQLRYIGINHNGRELVRVNRVNGQLIVVPEHQLQAKASEPYFQQVLAMAKKKN